MDRLLPEQVELYLHEYGWNFHAMGNQEWVSGWQGTRRSYPLVVTLTDSWVLFEVRPLISPEIDWENWPELTKAILELNYDSQLVKIGINEYNEIVLILQMFSARFCYEMFSDALGVIGHYTDVLYDEIMRKLCEVGFNVNVPIEYLA